MFLNATCHPKMAMVIDDRREVWDENDQPRVHVVRAFSPYHSPQAEVSITLGGNKSKAFYVLIHKLVFMVRSRSL